MSEVVASEPDRGEAWTVAKVLAWATADLKKRGSTSPRLDVELLLCEALSTDRVHLIVDGERPLSKEELASFRAMYTRRRRGEPIAYLLGRREFYGRTFKVDARVLIPRPDTEALVEEALARTNHLSLSARVLDLCTGSGCVAVSYACERPTTRVLATDVSEGALVVARENALRLGAVRVAFAVSDLFSNVDPRARFDLITANPPYIAASEVPSLAVDIREFEPKIALTPGEDPLAIVRRIVADAPRHLEEGGALAIEIGAGQAREVMELFDRAGFADVRARRDYGGHERVVSGVRGAAQS